MGLMRVTTYVCQALLAFIILATTPASALAGREANFLG